ncbi:hypothetical protein LT679_01860 [Mucilaginibacter roseus]|uniref:Nitrogen regulatory IIA protein n=1 Tax=Mucilaginibacter roseus TaxID=1528868 RepID=A0ABS8U075_9SPHI|nr:hypothetical protein [Mucilaginibacter roseus]MCD8739334.1 hypothetical protein [Mucilaginibacter roseus]
MKALINRFSDWFNSRSNTTQATWYVSFCLLFILAIWLSISYIKFDAQVYQTNVPTNIGKSSGELPDSITSNK